MSLSPWQQVTSTSTGRWSGTNLLHPTLFYLMNQQTPLRSLGKLARTAFRAPRLALAELQDRRLFNELLFSAYEGMSEDRLLLLADDAFESVVKRALYANAKELVTRSRDLGHEVILVSGALDFLMERLARHLGATGVIANRLEIANGVATGKLRAPRRRRPGEGAAHSRSRARSRPRPRRVLRVQRQLLRRADAECRRSPRRGEPRLPTRAARLGARLARPSNGEPVMMNRFLSEAFRAPPSRNTATESRNKGQRSPLVVTLDRKSAPRTIFSGDRLIDIDLPAGARAVYPKQPLEPLKDVDAAIRYALNHPYGTEPLHAKLRPGMKVVIAIDDISLPLPPMRAPDVRERVLTIVLELLADHGVDDFDIIIATSLHRRMTGPEVRHMVGAKIFDAYWPKRLYNHDAEDPKGMKEVGTTDHGEVIELNRKAVESDLVIYVNLNLVPMDGGHKSVSVGLCGYESLKFHHEPQTMRKCHSYMDPKASELSTRVNRMGRVTNKALNVLTIETTINNRMFDRPLEFLHKNEDDLSGGEQSAMKGLKFALDALPQGPARRSSIASRRRTASPACSPARPKPCTP